MFIEQCFRQVKAKFPIIYYGLPFEMDVNISTVAVAFKLHNFCKDYCEWDTSVYDEFDRESSRLKLERWRYKFDLNKNLRDQLLNELKN